MRNRNTVGDQWHPNPRPQTNSIQRKTITNPQLNQTQTQARQATQQQLNQKMANNINNTLLRLPSQANRASISSSLLPKASTMISTISAFMNSIDRNFQKSNLDVQGIPQLLSFWGYPHSYNKSVFQPIGAPHTWPTCLQMMEFFADICNYVFEYRNQAEECQLDVEEVDLVLDAFSRDDLREFQDYLERLRTSYNKEEEDLIFKIESAELTLRNIKNSQRSVVELEAEQAVLLQKLQRESQNVIQIDQQNNSILNEIQKTDDTLEQLHLTKQSLLNKIKMLQQEISNQELSAQQASKIEFEIKQYHSRIRDAQNQLQMKRKQFQAEKNKIVDCYYGIVDQLNQIKNSMKRYQDEMEKRGIDIPVPQADHVAFTEAIHTEDMAVFQQAVGKMIEGEKVKAMLLGQETLADVLERETKSLGSQLAETHSKRSLVQQQKKQITTQVTKLQKYQHELQKQLQTLTSKRSQIAQQIQNLKQSSTETKSHNEQLLRRQIQLTQQTRQRKQYMVEGIKMLKKYESDCENVVKAMEDRERETRRKVEEILERISGGFGYLNGELQGLL